jgi:exodeoxyribonuclease-3
MKCISWNVNGIRAMHKKGGLEELFSLGADIIGIQETKSTPDQLIDAIKNPKGYFSYFDSAKERKGYSGTAVYTRIQPEKVEYGIGSDEYDIEGRCVTLHFKTFAFVTCYMPNGGRDEEHFKFKLRYYKEFLKHIQRLEKKYKHVIFCGDFNVAHKEIDLARPKENEKSIGFLPVERAYVDELERAGMVDTFRALHPNTVTYSWWDQKTRSRERNIGWRIDYFFITKSLRNMLTKATILTDVHGSDHAPTLIEIAL